MVKIGPKPQPPLRRLEARSSTNSDRRRLAIRAEVDGVRGIAFRTATRFSCNRKRPAARALFPDVVANLERLPSKSFVLDGELRHFGQRSSLSFDELQLRLHPAASRGAEACCGASGSFIVFDLLA